MGYYLTDAEMGAKGKAAFLHAHYGAIPFDIHTFVYGSMPPDMVPVCVIDNGTFEVAGLAYNKSEFARFAADDILNRGPRVSSSFGIKVFDMHPTHQRQRWWLLMDRDTAYRLAGYGGGV